MNTSTTIAKISAALVKAQSEMSNAKKDAVNPFFKKNYADLNAIREAVLPVLNSHGISAIQPMCVIDGAFFVETILLHETGEYISSLTPVINDKPNDSQRHGSGVSYARRYALQSIVNIGAEDDDGNAQAKPGQQPAAVKQPEPAKKEVITSWVTNVAVPENLEQLSSYWESAPVEVRADKGFIKAVSDRKKSLATK